MNRDTSSTGALAARTPAIASAQLSLAGWLVIFLVAATLPYLWLIENFGYDDVLREPAAVVLTRFQDGGSPLILAWLAFAFASLLFIPVARGFRGLLSAHAASDHGADLLGIASAVAQAIGLMRWVFVVPALAANFTDPHSSPAIREAAVLIFDVVHRYGGMVIGEFVGQMLLAGWTALVSWSLFQSRAVPRWLAAGGALTLPFWLVGQTELLHGVVPAVPAIEAIPIAFIGWQAWLAALAVSLCIGGVRAIRGVHHGPA